ncbi:ComF family protein [Eionea flava]
METTMIPKEWVRLYRQLRNTLQAHTSTFKKHLHLPHTCALCDSYSPNRLCPACIEQFLQTPRFSCRACALPLPHSALLCGECLQHIPPFEETYSPFIYQKPLSDLIFQFKDQGDYYAGKALADIFCQQVQQHLMQHHKPLPDLITAVPLHWKKQQQRGINQSAFFAHYLSKQLNIPLFTQVKRTQASPDQKQLTRQQRLQNIQNSFAVSSTLQRQHIILVDDVMTTGATVSALTTALKKAGAGKVSVWVLARVPKQPL